MAVRVCAVTVTCAVPVTPPADAVTVVVPGESASKSPVVAFTTPTAVLLLVQVNSTPEIACPAWSSAVAVNWQVPPTIRSATSGETFMAVRVCAVTVTCAVPVAPPADAVTVVLPGESASKRPVVAFTTPTVSLLLVQVKPVSGVTSIRRSNNSAVKFTLSPTLRVAEAGVTVMAVALRMR
ncbi:hypothetical protein DSECCO2_429020 [anaerobic digester metagenome]